MYWGGYSGGTGGPSDPFTTHPTYIVPGPEGCQANHDMCMDTPTNNPDIDWSDPISAATAENVIRTRGCENDTKSCCAAAAAAGNPC